MSFYQTAKIMFYAFIDDSRKIPKNTLTVNCGLHGHNSSYDKKEHHGFHY
jgi:hypothetical protein